VGIGVIDVPLLGIIRRWHIRDQVPLREIARRLGISRNTVRRYLRSETIEPAYAERRSNRAIDKYAFQQRRTLKQIHEDLKELRVLRQGGGVREGMAGGSDREGQSCQQTNNKI
jgi:AcrR family transcriptional regulator